MERTKRKSSVYNDCVPYGGRVPNFKEKEGMKLKKEQFDVTGMTCSACSARIEKSVSKLPGIKEVSVNLLKNSMVASYDESILDTSGIIQAVEKAGYGAIPKTLAQSGSKPAVAAGKPEISTAQKDHKQMKQRLLLSAVFTIPLFYISMGHMMGWPLPAFLLGMENAMSFAFTQFLLLIPVVFVNFKYYKMGFKTLLHGSPNMDSLIAIGSSAAIIYGIYAIYKIGIGFGHGDMETVHSFMMDLYFESAGMILTLITLGKTLEARAKGKTSDAITKLMNLAPKTAVVERNGQEITIPVEEVQAGETLIVKAGEAVPVDVKALKNSRTDNIKPFLLIIEEINRANVAAVFGDIFQLLDRGDDFVSEYPIQATEDVKKYLAKELGGDPCDYNKIKIPDNMFIWATMNSADQGVFPMDTAFKRRWDFTYLGIDDNDQDLQGKYVYLADDKSQKVEWNKLRKAINNFLAKEKINEDKQLGPYFISRSIVVPNDSEEIDRDRFINTFKNKVIMYLFEDAAKQKRPRLFEGCFLNSSRYSEICREFEAKGVGIFNHDIQLDCEVEDVKYGDTTQE